MFLFISVAGQLREYYLSLGKWTPNFTNRSLWRRDITSATNASKMKRLGGKGKVAGAMRRAPIYICRQDRCYLVIEMFQKSQLKSVCFIIERRVEVQ